MPDVEGQELIILRPGDNKVPYQFKAAPCSSSLANDGSIPYNTNVASAVVTVRDADGTLLDDGDVKIADSEAVVANVITVQFKYPTSGPGRYTIYIAATLDNVDATVVSFVADRIKAEAL